MNSITPITLFAYNRSDHLRRTLTALAANDLASQTPLTIFCDGEKIPGDPLVAAAREVAHSATGFASVRVVERGENLGLARSIITGVSESFVDQDRVIVFEDDLVSSPYTLRYLNNILDRYEKIPTVFAGGSWSPRPELMPCPPDYSYDVYFLRRFFCLGWVTWKDRWANIDWAVHDFDELEAVPALQTAMNRSCGSDLYPMLRDQLEGKISSWAVRFCYAHFKYGGYSVNPVRSYLTHIGNDETGTHCRTGNNFHENDISFAIPTPTFPPCVYIDDSLNESFLKALSPQSYFDEAFCKEDNSTLMEEQDTLNTQLEKQKQQIYLLENDYKALEKEHTSYIGSPFIRGAIQLKNIYTHKDWKQLPFWCWRAACFAGKKILGKNPDIPFLTPLEKIERAFASGDIDAAYTAACELKKKGSLRGLDVIRARIFLARGEPLAAVQALREELRYFSDNIEAERQLNNLIELHPSAFVEGECQELFATIEPYTMVGTARLISLYNNARQTCEATLSGNFVECGVAAGGTSGLLSAVLQRHDTTAQKRLFSFDTFSGMPKPTDADTHQGQDAQASGWGEGTCAAPQESLLQLARTLGTTHLIHPVKGFFADTLPVTRASIGPIALLHMDGDWYESTRDILIHLYDQLVPGAYVQVDDYGHWEGCRKALHEFFEERSIEVELHPIDGTGVWFHVPEKQPGAFEAGVEALTLITATKNTKQQSGSAVLVNLGCGSRWHSTWINIDLHGDDINVFTHNFRLGVPLPNASADCIYTSHCLEHFTPQEAEAFLKACRKALKPSGLLRIVVPDLEQIVRFYLANLDAAKVTPDDPLVSARHNWMIVELIDQLCRHQSGGEMLRLWAQPEVAAEDFIISRVGTEYLNARKGCRGVIIPSSTEPQQVGQFRLGGEPHQWMYDEQSLSRLLRQYGFYNVRKVDAVTSALESFSSYNLDTNADGSVYKPDSLYMEALACNEGASCA